MGEGKVNGAQGGPPVKSDSSLVQQLEALANEMGRYAQPERHADSYHEGYRDAFDLAEQLVRAVLEGTKAAAKDDALDVEPDLPPRHGICSCYCHSMPGFKHFKACCWPMDDNWPDESLAPSAVVVDDTRQDDAPYEPPFDMEAWESVVRDQLRREFPQIGQRFIAQAAINITTLTARQLLPPERRVTSC